MLTITLLCVQYSFSLTTFSPSGKLVQIEYALNAVAAGATSLGIKATNGVVIATEKKLRTTLVDEAAVQKISLLTPNIGVAYSGMGPDSRVLVRKARKQAQVGAAVCFLPERPPLQDIFLYRIWWDNLRKLQQASAALDSNHNVGGLAA